MQLGRMGASVGAVAALTTASVALAASSAPSGSVQQAPGKAGCYTADGSSEAGPGTCHNIRGGGESTTLTVSPDGRFAYLDGYGTSSTTAPAILAVFRRNPKTGVLTQLSGKAGCFSRNGASEDGPNTCTKARDLDSGDATSIAISRDGRFLYVASQLHLKHYVGGIAIFARNLKTGKLRQLSGKAGCVTATKYKGCAIAREVDEVSNVHISPDQKSLYASNYGDYPHSGVAVFARDQKNGTLHQLTGDNGCISGNGTSFSSGGKRVCRAVKNVSNPWDVATPDNQFAYIPSSANGTHPVNLVQAFRLNSAGGLVPLTGKGGCVSDDGTSPSGPCVHGRGLTRPERAVLSKNGRFLYINSYGEGTESPVAVLQRDPKSGLLSQRKGPSACISADGTTGDGATCQDGRAIDGGYAGVLSPDGRTLYYAEFNADGFAIFRVSPSTGAIHQLSGRFGCVTADGSSEDGANTCETGRAVAGAYQVALGSSGRDVYVAGDHDNGEALFYAHK